MRKIIPLFILISFIFSLQPFCLLAQFSEKILVVVNGEPITQTDVDEILTPIYMQYKNTYEGKQLENRLNAARADILKQLIEDKLILQEAKKQELTVDEKEVEELIDELKNKFQTPQEFDATLENQKLTLNDLKKRYAEQQLIKKVVGKEVLNKIVITPAEISQYYKEHKEDFHVPAQVHLKNIFLKLDENGDKEKEANTTKKINDIYAQLEKGVEFVELVEKYSEAPNVVDAGNMGYLRRGSMREEIEDAVFKLKVGEFTKPIKTSSGYYIFKVIEKQDAFIAPQENVQDKIREELYQVRLKEKLKNWINKLKESALIEVKTNEEKS